MWRGGTGSRIRGRSLALREFLAALVPGVQYVSLQRELPPEDLDEASDAEEDAYAFALGTTASLTKREEEDERGNNIYLTLHFLPSTYPI